MPQISDTVPRVSYKFKGKTIAVPAHFTAGSPLSENEAKFANRQLASVLGNVLASALSRLADKRTEDAKKADPNAVPISVEAIPDADAQTMFDAIYSNYDIGANNARGEGASVHDPVEAIANNIAWERVKVLLKTRNIKVGSVKADKKAELVKQMRDRDPSILEAAKSQVGAVTPTDGLDDMFAGLTVEPTPADTNSAPDTSTATDTASTSIAGGAGSDTITGTDTNSGGATPGMVNSNAGPTDGGPPASDSIPSSTAEIGGATAEDSGVTPANPGAVGSTEEGTGQGTPVDGADTSRTTNAGEEQPVPTPEANPAPSPGAFA